VLDPRFEKLADLLVRHSIRLRPGERVLVETYDIPEDFTIVLIRAIDRAGGQPICLTKQNRVLRELYRAATVEQMAFWGSIERAQMEGVQAYIGVRGSLNATELGDVPAERMAIFQRHLWHPVHGEVRVPKTRWVVLRWPSPSMAQQAKMSTQAFEDHYFDVCTVDYGAMAKAMVPLRDRMARTDRVRIVGPGTDLRFSIRGMPVVGCAGERNIPDGEMFTSPVLDSVDGRLSVNAASLHLGVVYERIELEFSRGRIVRASGTPADRLQALIDTDEGARRIGEFSLGFNPRILHPMMDTLFDEKIAGSFHITPGQAYEEADNGNRSEIHWDLVVIQRPEYGGGEIWFDDEPVRKDGLFVVPDLAGLNHDRFPS
jgi:aminopeptidase